MGQSKIKSFKEVCKVCHKLQKEGKRVVFCAGIFDIIHKGHVRLLIGSKKLGDVLVVGVDHDDNAKILKGLARPINNQESRMFVLANLTSVDYVFLIESFKSKYLKDGEKAIDTFYDNIYSKLKPNIVTTCMRAGKYGEIKKKRSKRIGAKFVDIKHGVYDAHTSKTVKILGFD